MILAGDEIGRTQNGNNNTYCQDNDTGWIIWDKLEENQDIFRFVKLLIAFRKSQPNLRRQIFFDDKNASGEDIQWHGRLLNKPDWSNQSLCLAFHLLANENNPNDIYVISNVATAKNKFQLPELQINKNWYEKCNTSKLSTDDIHPENSEKDIDDQNSIQVEARSTIILISKQS
jgi:glycogen operon protein